jgi:hypothetical protein
MDEQELRLYGVAELAERWGVTKQRASELASRMDEPFRLACGRIWTNWQVLAYERESGRAPVTSE